ncbi:DUF6879 family protein [Sinosporangium siamense]|uniref:DUF6879 domain-containing protein n=1 Tax=Sinosporangium siamense TaxID=1367973 RepID=A0A919V5K6_9ACTN|nr:DUF6879 family protein [Sinosporangium siamense]GII93120.1 hypothetical protein Ssi02_33510 [Sinosporangium siamense]
MSEILPVFPGHRLGLDDYIADYYHYFWQTDSTGCWKLERRQTFRELNNPSWEASSQGDWPCALKLLEEGRAQVKDYQRRVLEHGFEFRRVRIVEVPFSAYLIWELNSLLIRHEYGERIRVVTGGAISRFERHAPLPEIVVLGTQVVYQVIYGSSGLAEGAMKSTDPTDIRFWADFIERLYGDGEELDSYFQREVAGLRPVEEE